MITIDDILKWFCTKCDTEPRCDELPDLDRDLCATRSKLAKLKGKKLGRPYVKIDWELIESWKAKGISERAAVRVCGYAYTTFYRQKKERESVQK